MTVYSCRSFSLFVLNFIHFLLLGWIELSAEHTLKASLSPKNSIPVIF